MEWDKSLIHNEDIPLEEAYCKQEVHRREGLQNDYSQ